MILRKAIITAAGPNQRALPLQSLVDRDGTEKTALQIILEEVIAAGAEEIAVIIGRGDHQSYAQAAGEYADRIHFVEQHQPRGYGHALGLARSFTRAEPFLHLVSDHLYISKHAQRCAQQVVERAKAEKCSVSAVQATRENMLPYYGTVGGRRATQQNHLYEIERVLEKPTPSEAEQKLIVPGLRAGHYLCFFGIHVFTPEVMDLLHEAVSRQSSGDGIQLSPILDQLAARQRYLALEVQGRRYNIGVKFGILLAQLALALDGQDRESVLAQLVELLANRSLP